MIVITRTPNSITVCGHANFARHGKDIVCAAVSVLLQTLINSITQLTDDEMSFELSKGDSYMTIKNPSEKAQLLIGSFFIGVNGIAAAYPDHVKVVE